MKRKLIGIIYAIVSLLIGLQFGIIGIFLGIAAATYGLKYYGVFSKDSIFTSETKSVKKAKYVLLVVAIIFIIIIYFGLSNSNF